MVKQVNQKIIDSTLEYFIQFFNRKRESKGTKSFNSIWEISGKLHEEFNEFLTDVHEKNLSNAEKELLDIAVVALFGIMSLRTNDPKDEFYAE